MRLRLFHLVHLPHHLPTTTNKLAPTNHRLTHTGQGLDGIIISSEIIDIIRIATAIAIIATTAIAARIIEEEEEEEEAITQEGEIITATRVVAATTQIVQTV